MSEQEYKSRLNALKPFVTLFIVVMGTAFLASCGGGSSDTTQTIQEEAASSDDPTKQILGVSGGAVPAGWKGRVPLPSLQPVSNLSIIESNVGPASNSILMVRYSPDLEARVIAFLTSQGWKLVAKSGNFAQINVGVSTPQSLAEKKLRLEQSQLFRSVRYDVVFSEKDFTDDMRDPSLDDPIVYWNYDAIKIKSAWDIVSTAAPLVNATIAVADTNFAELTVGDLKITTIISPSAETLCNANSNCEDHGYHVAGIIGAKGNDGLGHVGIGSGSTNQTRLIAANSGSMGIRAHAFTSLLQSNPRVLNISLAINVIDDINIAPSTEKIEKARVASIEDAGAILDILEEISESRVRQNESSLDVLFVQAAGNAGRARSDDGNPIRSEYQGFMNGFIEYSKSSSLYNSVSQRVLIVGSFDKGYKRSDFSQWPIGDAGRSRFILAPGRSISSNVRGSAATGQKSGTSMAAPHVSGVASLILQIAPNLSAAQLADVILTTASTNKGDRYSDHPNEDLAAGYDGYRYLDAEAAVREAIRLRAESNCGTISAPTIKPISLPTVVAGTPYTYSVTTTSAPKNGKTFGSYLWTSSEGFTNTAFVSPDIAITLSNPTRPPAVATVAVTPVLNDGTVCTASRATSQFVVQENVPASTTETLESAFTSNSTLRAPWSFGWQVSSGAAPIPYASFQSAGSRSDYPTFAIWNKVSGSAGSPPIEVYPWVVKNMGASPVLYSPLAASFPAQSIIVTPGSAGERAVFRWTAPAAGTYAINASYELMQGGAVDVHVQRNGVDIFNANIARQGSQAIMPTQTVILSAGDTMDFVVGDGGNTQNSDMTRVSASVLNEAIRLKNLALSETFTLATVDSSKWNNNGHPGAPRIGTVSIDSNGVAQFGAWGAIDTQGKVTFSGAKIIIEARMGGVESRLMLTDGQDATQSLIMLSNTPYCNWGMNIQAQGRYRPSGDNAGCGANIPVPHAGNYSSNMSEYRLTIDGYSVIFENGPSLSDIRQTLRMTLGASISGRSFFLTIGTGSDGYSPGAFDWVRVSSDTSSVINYLTTPQLYDNAQSGYAYGQSFTGLNSTVSGVKFYIGDPSRPDDVLVNAIQGQFTLLLYEVAADGSTVLIASKIFGNATSITSGAITASFDTAVNTTLGRKYFIGIRSADPFGLGLLEVYSSSYAGGSEAWIASGTTTVTEHSTGRDTSFMLLR